MTNIESLRKGTSDLHKTLEGMMYSDAIMNKTLSETQLNHLLLVNYLFFKRVESILSNQKTPASFHIDKASRAKKDLIRNGYHPQDVDYKLSADYSLESLYGILYVVIGSSLGANLISKKLLGNSRLNNSSFDFYKSAQNDRHIWTEFLKELEHKLMEQDKLVSQSVNCFRSMIDLFNLTAK